MDDGRSKDDDSILPKMAYSVQRPMEYAYEKSIKSAQKFENFAQNLMGGTLGFDTEKTMIMSNPSQLAPSKHWKLKLISHYLMANI